MRFRLALLAGLAIVAVLVAAAPPKSLAIVRPTLSQYEDGPPLPSDFHFIPGDTVFFSFQVEGYQVSGGDEPKADLLCEMDAVDPRGVLLAEPARKQVRAELSPEDKEWMPKIRQTVLIPPLAGSGVYRIRVLARDNAAGREVRLEVPLRVRGREVEPSETLTVRAFRFLRGEEDGTPLQPPAYRPGSPLWARFDIIGFRYGKNNRIQVEYGLAVLGASGRALYAEPRAAAEEGESFYPKRYLPGVLNLNLDSTVQRGAYTIVLTVRDQTGNQTHESRHEFRIE